MSWVRRYPLIDLHSEYRFHPTRRWRFDYAHLPSLTAIEIEGGSWIRGRHTRGKGFIDDCHKYLEAAALGWAVLRISPCMIQDKTLDRIACVIQSRLL